MIDWLSTYNETIGMHNVAILTTIFGSFCVTFAVIICWGKLVEDFGAFGGMMAAGMIIGTFWLLNHKLPGFGINPETIKDTAGQTMQFGLIQQGARGAAPWIDMGWGIAMGLLVCGIMDSKRSQRTSLIKEAIPRIFIVSLGGLVGGAFVGLIGYTGAKLFGW